MRRFGIVIVMISLFGGNTLLQASGGLFLCLHDYIEQQSCCSSECEHHHEENCIDLVLKGVDIIPQLDSSDDTVVLNPNWVAFYELEVPGPVEKLNIQYSSRPPPLSLLLPVFVKKANVFHI